MLRRLDGPPSPALATTLRTTGLLAQLDPVALDAVTAEVEWQFLAADDELFAAGEPAAGMSILVAGRLDVRDEHHVRLRRIGVGEPVGESSLLSDRLTTTSVRAARDSVLAYLSRQRFEQLALTHPAVLLALTRVLADRLRHADAARPVHDAALVLAVAPASRGARVDAFARRLADRWTPGRARCVGAREAAAELGPLGDAASPDHERLTRWLHAHEHAHAALILVADADDSAWTRFVLREADTVLLVADAGASPTSPIAALHRPAREGAADRRELVLLHPPRTTTPQGTRRWLDAFPVAAHHHVREGDDLDLDRVVRCLTGRAITLVLSGGAARAIAHIGAVQALEEAHVPVDRVCGTSMGAVVAGLLARGRDAEQTRVVMRRHLVEQSIYDLTVPLVSAVAGRHLDRFMTACFGDLHIEDLWRPFFCVSSNLGRGVAVVHDRGRVADAVRCSSAVPGLFPPVQRGGELLIDGLFLDNMPVAAARRRAAGRVIAVNVISLADPGFGAFPEGRGVAQWLRALNPFAAAWQPPPIVGLVLQAFFLGTMTAAEQARRDVDLYVEPPVGHIQFLETARFDEAVELGHRAMQASLATWRP